MNNTFTYTGPFMGKPRMVRSDAWKKRPVVERYWAIKDFMILQARQQKFELGDRFTVVFLIPMPKWSKKKRKEMAGKPHKQKPDLDNLLKASMDILMKDDSIVWGFSASKFWYEGEDYQIDIINKKHTIL